MQAKAWDLPWKVTQVSMKIQTRKEKKKAVIGLWGEKSLKKN